jgi:hypothetical protein
LNMLLTWGKMLQYHLHGIHTRLLSRRA